ncbi:hypothetical protein [Rhodococcus sp. UNC363MFTsu5.1]|uniref:hypothetical protein n=1 Tax=Rhodococcus sp. UNC363MFTsu5.1 TaxID=1449069 RepID=UPI0004829D67|nr:hypothetical protein [Rhodococcus sp. UNC363MFTsu5.1]
MIPPPDPIGTVQALTAAVETPWGTYAPGVLVTITAATETGWIIDVDPLPTPGRRHRIEIPATALTAWAEGPALHGRISIPADALAELYLNATIEAQMTAESLCGTTLIDALVARHDARKAA